MPTFHELVKEVRSKVSGYTLNQDRITYLAGSMTTSSTTFSIVSTDNFAKGIVEIDEELMWVDSYNKSTAAFTVAPGFGRGYNGTTAATHSANAPVTLSPSFPTISIKQAVNDTIAAVFPKLWGISSYTFTYNPSVVAYSLPAEVQDVLSVSWQTVGSSKEWLPVKRYRVDPMASAAAFGTNNSLSIYDPVTAGRTVLVWYTTEPASLSSNSDDFATVSKLPSSTKDVIVLGAAARLLSFLDAGRINVTSAEADMADSKLPSNAGASISRYVYALYQQRLNEEAGKLQGKYPTKIHYTR